MHHHVIIKKKKISKLKISPNSKIHDSIKGMGESLVDYIQRVKIRNAQDISIMSAQRIHDLDKLFNDMILPDNINNKLLLHQEDKPVAMPNLCS